MLRSFSKLGLVGKTVCPSILHRFLITHNPSANHAYSIIKPNKHSYVSITQRQYISMSATNATTDIIPPPTSPISKIKIALCQISVSPDKNTNISTAKSAISRAASQGANLIVLPEMWNCPYSNDSFPTYAEHIPDTYIPTNTTSSTDYVNLDDSPSFTALSEAAAQHSVVLVGGSIPERVMAHSKNSNNNRSTVKLLYNTCCIFNKDGSLVGKHRKTHLFDIDIPGGITFKESDTLTSGDSLTVVDTDVGRLGVGICYDIRFPELAAIYASRGAHMVIYPGAFNMTTGPVHWELLQKARAVDNQMFIAACSPARDDRAGYVAWGHSSVVGPFAEILGKAGSGEEIVYAELDLEEVERRREHMPLQKQKRGELYSLLDKTR